jgi:hypothetical protein
MRVSIISGLSAGLSQLLVADVDMLSMAAIFRSSVQGGMSACKLMEASHINGNFAALLS